MDLFVIVGGREVSESSQRFFVALGTSETSETSETSKLRNFETSKLLAGHKKTGLSAGFPFCVRRDPGSPELIAGWRIRRRAVPERLLADGAEVRRGGCWSADGSGRSTAACDDGVDEFLEDDADGADGVIVCCDRVIHQGWIRVRVHDCDRWDFQTARFCDGDSFASGVDDDDCAGEFLHCAHAFEVTAEFFTFATESGKFLFPHLGVLGLLLDVLDVMQTGHALPDGFDVRQGATEPALVDVELTTSGCGFLDGFLRLLFAAHEEDFFTLCSEIGEELRCSAELADGFAQVDDVD